MHPSVAAYKSLDSRLLLLVVVWLSGVAGGFIGAYSSSKLSIATSEAEELRDWIAIAEKSAWDERELMRAEIEELRLRLERRGPSASPTRAGGARTDRRLLQPISARYAVERSTVERLLDGRLEAELRGARIVPAVRDGNPTGYSFYEIGAASIYRELGLLERDTVRAVNGFELVPGGRAPEPCAKGMEYGCIVESVRESGRIEAEFVRDGKAFTVVVELM